MTDRHVDERWGGFTLRLVERADQRFDGIVFGREHGTVAKVRGEPGETDAEVRARLKQEAMRRHPDWVGYAGAIRFFRRQFSDGFHGDAYLRKERNFKQAAKRKLDEAVPLAAARANGGCAAAVLRALPRTKLLAKFELMRLEEVLKGPTGDAFIRGAAMFAAGDLASGLRAMGTALKPHDAAKWTIATYLPFLWQPDTHMFLKPEVTKLFADRVGHEFALLYRPDLELDVYRSLLDLATGATAAIGALRPRDRIDVQSFIWVVGRYSDPQ